MSFKELPKVTRKEDAMSNKINPAFIRRKVRNPNAYIARNWVMGDKREEREATRLFFENRSCPFVPLYKRLLA